VTDIAMPPTFDSVNIGDLLPPLSLPPVTRGTLALYAEASGDPNPIHVDADFARAAGMPDVVAHGMLLMAWLGRLLTHWAPQRDLREFGVRFSATTKIGERITCTGRVVDKQERDGERLAKIEVKSTNDAGELKVVGDAWIALP
jgi:acyl dehydratase